MYNYAQYLHFAGVIFPASKHLPKAPPPDDPVNAKVPQSDELGG